MFEPHLHSRYNRTGCLIDTIIVRAENERNCYLDLLFSILNHISPQVKMLIYSITKRENKVFEPAHSVVYNPRERQHLFQSGGGGEWQVHLALESDC